MTLSIVRDDDGAPTNYVSIFADITQVKDAEQQVDRLTNFDPLTGLPKRALITDRLESALGRARSERPVAVMVMDIDRFRHLNDTLGHPAGDELLAQVALRLSAQLGDEASVGRDGGDEFTIVVEAAGPGALDELVGRVRSAFEPPFQLDGRDLYVTASIGVAVAPADGTDPGSLLKRADAAEYEAKRAGGDRVAFASSATQVEFAQRLDIDTGLRVALRDQQFVLHYQPQIELASGRVHGVESLIRWNRPGSGLVPPGVFIGIAQDTGLIVPMTAWAMKTACAEIGGLAEAAGVIVDFSVNFTAHDFLEADLVTDILSALGDCALKPERFEVEITEGALLEDAVAAAEKLDQLRAAGINVALDDFGTGYSSLSYLREFHVGRLKIDKSFVDGLPGDPDSCAIVDATLAMAAALGIETIAEGVENAEQAAHLRERGCTYIQGFYFSKPLPLAELEQFLTRGPVKVP
jgi:diguanylate cyclase (GGDEF)-like protein